MFNTRVGPLLGPKESNLRAFFVLGLAAAVGVVLLGLHLPPEHPQQPAKPLPPSAAARPATESTT